MEVLKFIYRNINDIILNNILFQFLGALYTKELGQIFDLTQKGLGVRS